MAVARAAAVAAAMALLAPAAPAAGTGAGEPPVAPWTRGRTPALSGVERSGRSLDLAALRGRVVLVAFWASWCEPCAEELAALERLRAALAGRPLEVLTVNLGEGDARMDAYVREHALSLPVLPDRDRRLGEAWGVGGLPMAFLVDARGRARASVFGASGWSAGPPRAALERLLAEAERAGRPKAGEARR